MEGRSRWRDGLEKRERENEMTSEINKNKKRGNKRSEMFFGSRCGERFGQENKRKRRREEEEKERDVTITLKLFAAFKNAINFFFQITKRKKIRSSKKILITTLP